MPKITIKDAERVDNFYPFSVLHPIWELRCGILKIYEKYQNLLGTDWQINYSGIEDIVNSFLDRNEFSINTDDSNNYFIGNFIPHYIDIAIFKDIHNQKKNAKFYFKDKLVAQIAEFDNEAISITFTKSTLLNYLFDAIYINDNQIIDDLNMLNFSMCSFELEESYLLNRKNIYFGKNVRLMPSCVLDAENGPIIIDDNVKIMPQSTIIGPCYIGKNTTIKVGAKIYEKTSIGNNCKVGGEVENSIIQSFSNKQHDGFLGHSFISEWVNLGADTNTSDLKNTYSNISIKMRGQNIDSNSMFLGLLCGDHTKSAINTQFNTGTVAGICAILFREGFLSNDIPSFSWGGGRKDNTKYKLGQALETAGIVMQRRSKLLSQLEINLITAEYNR